MNEECLICTSSLEYLNTDEEMKAPMNKGKIGGSIEPPILNFG